MSVFGGLWKRQNNRTCTKCVRVRLLKLEIYLFLKKKKEKEEEETEDAMFRYVFLKRPLALSLSEGQCSSV